MSTKKVNIYAGAGTGTREFETSASNWGTLHQELTNAGLSLNGVTAVIGETEATLESTGAILPNENFTLFLLPSKVRSGNDEPTQEGEGESPLSSFTNNGIFSPNTTEEIISMITAIADSALGNNRLTEDSKLTEEYITPHETDLVVRTTAIQNTPQPESSATPVIPQGISEMMKYNELLLKFSTGSLRRADEVQTRDNRSIDDFVDILRSRATGLSSHADDIYSEEEGEYEESYEESYEDAEGYDAVEGIDNLPIRRNYNQITQNTQPMETAQSMVSSTETSASETSGNPILQKIAQVRTLLSEIETLVKNNQINEKADELANLFS